MARATREQARAHSAKYRAANMDSTREAARNYYHRQGWVNRLVRRYNITEDKYWEMFKAQGGVCAVCGEPPRDRRLAVDHDHACCPGDTSCGKCVRGLLCIMDNQTLGRLGDDLERIRKLAEYLEGRR